MKLESLLRSKFKRNRTRLKHKVVAILSYYRNASFRGAAKSIAPYVVRSHEAVRQWWLAVDNLFTCECKYRPVLAIDETKVKVNGKYCFVWAIIDVKSKEVLATQVTAGRSEFDCLLILTEALRYCINKPRILTDGGAWYRWSIQRCGCIWERQHAGPRNHIERWFGRFKFRIKNFFVNFRGKSLENAYKNVERFLHTFVQMYHLNEVSLT